MTSKENVNVTVDAALRCATAEDCADCVWSEDSVGRCFVHSFSHQEPEDVLFADRLFSVLRRYWDVDFLVYELVNELLGTVPDEAENHSNYSGWSWDAYDRSLEVYGVLPTLRLTDVGVARLWRLGFKRAWLNHSDGGETGYADGRDPATVAHPETVVHAPRRRPNSNEVEVTRLRAQVERLRSETTGTREYAAAVAQRDEAYRERDRCVALVAKLAAATGYVVGLGRHEDDPSATTSWDDEWRNVAYVDLPTGQVSWHFHDSELSLFASLPPYAGKWDGHSTEEKYERCAAYSIPLTRQPVEVVERHASPPIWVLVQVVVDALPSVVVNFDGPALPNGHWFVDFYLGERRVIAEWRDRRGFGVSSAAPDGQTPGTWAGANGYGRGPEEVFDEVDDAAARVVELLRAPTGTAPTTETK